MEERREIEDLKLAYLLAGLFASLADLAVPRESLLELENEIIE